MIFTTVYCISKYIIHILFSNNGFISSMKYNFHCFRLVRWPMVIGLSKAETWSTCKTHEIIFYFATYTALRRNHNIVTTLEMMICPSLPSILANIIPTFELNLLVSIYTMSNDTIQPFKYRSCIFTGSQIIITVVADICALANFFSLPMVWQFGTWWRHLQWRKKSDGALSVDMFHNCCDIK